MTLMRRAWMVCAALLCASACLAQTTQPAKRQLAFPTAEGFGAYAQGGRGGRVIYVTNTKNAGPGSLREAVDAKGPRTILFQVGGMIRLHTMLLIREPYVTIDAQTAPGDGICIQGRAVSVETHDVILRGLRVRAGDDQGDKKGSEVDSLSIGKENDLVHDVILDHCSFSWAIDENLSTWYPVRDVTIQWCVISEALRNSTHEKGAHSMGLLIGDHAKRVSVHHNLFASNDNRNPQPKGDTQTEVINNVMYNFGWSAIQPADPEKSGPSQVHVINNFFIPGPDTREAASCINVSNTMDLATRVYHAGNESDPKVRLIAPKPDQAQYMSDKAVFQPSGIRTQDAQSARDDVLKRAGAILPKRDSVDARIVEGVRTRTGKIIDSQKQVSGWPEYKSADAPPDADSDGLPDAWEVHHHLDRAKPGNNDDSDLDGYTDLEEFLNQTDPREAD